MTGVPAFVWVVLVVLAIVALLLFITGSRRG
jgi:hypothetical protein